MSQPINEAPLLSTFRGKNHYHDSTFTIILIEKGGFSYSDPAASQSAILTEAQAWSELAPHLYLLL